MNLVRRGMAADPAAAALAAAAALRSLEAAGVSAPTVWVARGARFDATAAWDHGIALVRVATAEGAVAAQGVVRAVGARLVLAATDLGNVGAPRGDGARLAARHELGLWPDEHVLAILGAVRDPGGLGGWLDAFDRELGADPGTPRRLVLAGLTDHGPALSELLLRAILHPSVLVELGPDVVTLDLLQAAADEVVG